jgi:hypothetical protein
MLLFSNEYDKQLTFYLIIFNKTNLKAFDFDKTKSENSKNTFIFNNFYPELRLPNKLT